MADERAEFRIDLSAPGAKQELEAAAKALGYFTRETKDADKEAERTRAGLTRFGQEFQRTSRWIGQATTDQERLARALTTMQHSASISGMKEYSKALEYVDRNLGEVAREAQTAEQALEALQRHAARRGNTDIAASLGGLRGWMDEIKPLAAELERPPTRMAAAWGRAAGAVQVAVGNVMAATAQAAAQAAKDAVLSGVQLAIQRESLEATLTSMLGGAEQMRDAMTKIEVASGKPGLTMNLVADSVMRLVQAGADLDTAIETVVQFGNAVAFVGGTEEKTRNALAQFNQMLITQRVTWEDLKPIIVEGGPQFAKALALAFPGKTVEQIQKMGTSAQEFGAKFVAALAQTERAPDLTANAILNLRNEWDKAKTAFAQGLLGDTAAGEVNDLSAAIKDITPALRDLGGVLNTQILPRLHNMSDLMRVMTGGTEHWTETVRILARTWLNFVNAPGAKKLFDPLGFGKWLQDKLGITAWVNEQGNEDVGSAATTSLGAVTPPAKVELDYGAVSAGGEKFDKMPAPGETAEEKKRKADEKRKADRAAYIAKVERAEASMRQSGVALPGFEGLTADQLQAEAFRAKKVQEKEFGSTADVWAVDQSVREAAVDTEKRGLQVKQQLVEADLDLIAMNRQEGADRRRSAVEQLAFLDKEVALKKELLGLQQAQAALDLDPAMEPARAKQAAVDMAVLEREAADERQKILKAEQDETEKSLRGKVEQANALLDLSRVEEGHGNAVRMKIQALIELERHYNSTGQTIEAMRTKTERLRLEQEKGQKTIAEQILAAGPGAGAISAMLKRQGVNASDLGEPGRGIWQQQATIDPSAFKSRHFRGDAPGGVADQAADKAIAAGGGRFVNQVAAAAELAAGRILDQVVDGLGRVT